MGTRKKNEINKFYLITTTTKTKKNEVNPFFISDELKQDLLLLF